jgi:hypothetical protein
MGKGMDCAQDAVGLLCSHTVILVCVCCFSFTCRLLRPSPSMSALAVLVGDASQLRDRARCREGAYFVCEIKTYVQPQPRT